MNNCDTMSAMPSPRPSLKSREPHWTSALYGHDLGSDTGRK